ncbi:MAG: response regulator transcription factor [Lachnospiraceae bacterium]|nr:response regulator transcription factor [Lachnospiraceae bacterium]MCI9100497.1 response regulator transcription factor [Lachnospiraceae bacterium]MCI9358432.1 response regulator transcription factor [Lachnospiraceae bacterium]
MKNTSFEKPYQILIVEDDQGLNQGIALALQEEGTIFHTAFSLAQAREIWQKGDIDLILLDINLPDGSGYDLLREIRQSSETPVLMLTANDLEVDQVTGFSLGADDYITKPFSLIVLRARVDRFKKRARGRIAPDDYQNARYHFRFREMIFFADGKEVVLSKTDQKLLRMFTLHPGQILSRERLIDAVWPDSAGYVDENALSVAVNRLRHKLEGKEKKCPIQTVYGLGYVWGKKHV